MYCRMLQGKHSAILLTFIKVPFVIKLFVLSIFETHHLLQYHFTDHQHSNSGDGFWILLDFSLTVKAAPHKCVIRTSQP